jgi:hypothetical protein
MIVNVCDVRWRCENMLSAKAKASTFGLTLLSRVNDQRVTTLSEAEEAMVVAF